MARITQQSSIHTTGTSYENEPVIKSDGASSDMMEWAASTGSSKVEIREDASNNLKLEVDGIPVASGLAGIDAAGLHFDGATGTYVNCGDSSILDSATRFSVEVVASTSSSTEEVLVGKRWNYECFALYNNAAGNILFKVTNGSSTASATSSGVYNDGNPHHVVGTWDGATLSIYVNGNLDGTATLDGGSLPNTDDKLALGAQVNNSLGNNANFDGILYRARLWNKSLTAAEVTATYENATVPFADQYGSQTELVSGWTNNGSFLYETFTTSGTTISEAANTSGAGICYSSVTLVAGKKYRIEQTFTLNSGTAPALRVATTTSVGTGGFLDVVPTSASEFEFTATTGGTFYVGYRIDSPGVCNFAVSGFSFVKVGCVADYDLAFANPTQSDQVQDRSTNLLDGTASSGVTQVTPIEQLNAKSLVVGTSAINPADGEADLTGGLDWARGEDVAGRLGYGTNMVYVGSNDTNGILELRSGNGVTAVTIDSTGNLESRIAPTPTATTVNETADFAGKVVIANGGTSAAGDRLPLVFNVGGNGADNISAAIVGEREASGWNSALSFWVNNVTAGSEGTDAIQEAMRIDSAGTTTITPTGNVKGLYFPTAPTTTDNVIFVEANALTTGRAGYFYSNSADTSTRQIVRIINDHASATGATCLEVRNDSTGRAITAIGGIVEEDGVLKENLLSNSGFDCWSNSTLVEATSGAAPVTNGATAALLNNLIDGGGFDDAGDITDNDPDNWVGSGSATLTSDSNGKTGNGLKIVSSSGNSTAKHTAQVVAGKLYQFSAYSDQGDVSARITMEDGYVYDSGDFTPATDYSTQTTFVFEATTTGDLDIYLHARGTGYVYYDSVCLYEVTPGVLGGTRAADGWGSGGLNTYREHWNGSGGDSDTTKTGSFYALKMVNASSSGYVEQLLDLGKFRGRTITLGVWVKTSTGSAARTKINGTVTTDVWSDYATDSDNWEWLETTMNVSASETYLLIQLRTEVASTVYWSQPILSLGSAIGEGNYSRPSGEIVWCEQPIDSNAFPGVTVSSNTTVGVEVDTNGKVPKGAKAVYAKLDGESAAVEKYLRLYPNGLSVYGAALFSQVANVRQSAQGFVQLDSSGDIRIARDDTFNTVGVTYQAVVLQ